ncbi:hypothetical protein [Mucilaginibacter sp. L3T2-6]|uniref:hypothetical protein n=1 Tax=Mucilaginibacter sp. L3T2-6 TaxID=3062491 RepID=UPI00267765C6|nr:hypothetical protein [Mucilaginibacter sp. L3T2-6]MDO3641245.1 hypothetical protein [Mucilaginibacter sp. L3T2-6]MDV6213995.1 hypothetical protein [Mucilaginibacter sp. L3T2-6]
MTVLNIAYYLWIGASFYSDELRSLLNRLNGRENAANELPAALRYQESEADCPASAAAVNSENRQQQEIPSDTDHLTGRLKACIAIASEKPFAPAVLIPQLKKILQEHPALAASAERPAINELIVNECEKTGTALLTEEEVDQWWSV